MYYILNKILENPHEFEKKMSISPSPHKTFMNNGVGKVGYSAAIWGFIIW